MRSGNKVSFKNMGSSSPAHQITISEPDENATVEGVTKKATEGPTKEEQAIIDKAKGKKVTAEEKQGITVNPNINKESYLTKQQIKQAAKTDKQKARGENTPGGRNITRAERSAIKDAKLASQLKRAEGLEAAGKGEKGFSWKGAGMSVLRGEGLLGNIASGIGKGRDKSAIIKDKQAKIAGKKERKELRATQDRPGTVVSRAIDTAKTWTEKQLKAIKDKEITRKKAISDKIQNVSAITDEEEIGGGDLLKQEPGEV